LVHALNCQPCTEAIYHVTVYDCAKPPFLVFISNNMILSELSIHHSPTGTGKSVTGAHLAYALIKCPSVVGAQQSAPNQKIRCVMYCGPSNKSVDVVLGMIVCMC